MRNQKGMSFASVMLMVAVGALLLKGAFTLIPMYWQNQMVSTIFETMEESGEAKDLSIGKMKKLLEERLQRNDLKLDTKTLTITEQKGVFNVEWPYEIRGTVRGNLDMVVRFHQSKEFTK